MTKFNKIYNLILEELTDKQKELTDKYTAQRNKNLSFGPFFKEERTYFPLNITEIIDIEIPDKIKTTLDNAGFYVTDYRTGLAMKKTKPGEEKDLRQIKIGKILSKLNQPNLLKQFNERLGTSKKDIQNIQFEICVTHNPYDIAGMSTDRNWTSCMNLDNGEYKDTALKQVQYGGMCAYLISNKDKNIEKPYARIAIKRFISSKDESKFIFAAENRIYGDINLAKELNFKEELIKILEQSNKLTANIGGKYIRKDNNSYSDTYDKYIYNFDKNYINDLTIDDIINAIQHDLNIPCETLKIFVKKDFELLSPYMWQIKCSDIDKELIEIFLQHNKVIDAFQLTNALTNQDAIELIIKYKNLHNILYLIYQFIYNKNIKFTQNDLKIILDISIKHIDTRDTYQYNFNTIFNGLCLKYKLNNELLHKYLPIIIKKDKEILESFVFLCSQEFSFDIMIKYFNKKSLGIIYDTNNNLSKENKEKLKQYLDQH